MFKMRFLRSSKCLKTAVELTQLATGKTVSQLESHLKLTVQIQLALHPYGSFFINNRNMNVVLKNTVVVLNVKLRVKDRFEKFY